MAIPDTIVGPTDGVTMKPQGPVAPSKFRYLAVVPEMTFATPSEEGVLRDDPIIWSVGCTTFFMGWAFATSERNGASAGSSHKHFLRVNFGGDFVVI
jgi:hypothetical protein